MIEAYEVRQAIKNSGYDSDFVTKFLNERGNLNFETYDQVISELDAFAYKIDWHAEDAYARIVESVGGSISHFECVKENLSFDVCCVGHADHLHRMLIRGNEVSYVRDGNHFDVLVLPQKE